MAEWFLFVCHFHQENHIRAFFRLGFGLFFVRSSIFPSFGGIRVHQNWDCLIQVFFLLIALFHFIYLFISGKLTKLIRFIIQFVRLAFGDSVGGHVAGYNEFISTSIWFCPAEEKLSYKLHIGCRMLIMQISNCVREFVPLQSEYIEMKWVTQSRMQAAGRVQGNVKGIDFLIKASVSPAKIKWFLVLFGKWQFNLHHNDNRIPLSR